MKLERYTVVNPTLAEWTAFAAGVVCGVIFFFLL